MATALQRNKASPAFQNHSTWTTFLRELSSDSRARSGRINESCGLTPLAELEFEDILFYIRVEASRPEAGEPDWRRNPAAG